MPLKELERLQGLSKYLKTTISLETELQAIAKTAANICGTPAAIITLISGGTQYISYSESFDFRDISREDDFCNFNLSGQEPLVVEDTLKDQRFINNALVKDEPKIRFYAGMPLTTHDGHNLGCLCVIDQAPASFSALKLKMLKMLAAQIIHLFEFESGLAVLKKQFTASKKMEIKLRSFFESSTSEHIILDRDYNVLAFNKRLMDFVQKAYHITIEKGMKVTAFVHENYMEDFIANCQKALSGQRVRHERQIQFGKNSHWCDITYDPAKNAEGEIIGVSYNSTDITDRILQQNVMLNCKAMLMRTAFLQSHELRKPVANIKGLLMLIKLDGHFDHIPAFIEMQNAINNLDEKIHVIVGYTDI